MPWGCGKLVAGGKRNDGEPEILDGPHDVGAGLLERSILYAIERKKHETSRLELVRARIARAEAEAANRTKDEFLATISHELRTPLNAILGWASLLRTRQLSPTEQTQALETIERNARVQAQLIEDLLDVSRIVTGNLRLNLYALDLSGVIKTALDVTKPLADQRNIRVEAELEPDLVCQGDSTRLQQVVWNLITNAIKFSKVNGQIWVRAIRVDHEELGECAQIRVQDQGQGIEAAMLPHIFERFFQADNSSTRRHGGLGLGLSIVRKLVELHGGRVRAASPGPGQGATFTVLLPLATREDKLSNSL